MFEFLATLFIPLAGAIALLFFKRENTRAIKYFSLGVSILSFLTSLLVFFNFNPNYAGFQYFMESVWVRQFDAGFRVGVDGISLLLVMLTTFLTPLTILSSFYSIHKREKEYYIMMLILLFAMIGVFISLDLFLFYIFWEIILIPMYFIIGIWGGKNRIYATVKFFIYTMVGSLLMLVAIIWLGNYVGSYIIHNAAGFTTNFTIIKNAIITHPIPIDVQKWMFLAFALSFCIKVPLFPLHTWLPDAHTEAPTPGSVILAGVLLKMGTYGLIRFNLELFPQASFDFAPYLSALGVIGIIYGALVSVVQTDFKRLVAYSSVSHLGFVVLGIFSMTAIGMQGAVIQMVNHGLSTGMLFLCVGMLYERRHTREISEFGGVARVMPAFTVFFAIAMLASVGLPGLNGFIGEYLTLIGAFYSPFLNSWAYTIIGATGVIFAAIYLLWMFQRVMFGEIKKPENAALKDINIKEWVTLVPIVIFIVWIGVHPTSFMKYSEQPVRALANKLHYIKDGTTPFPGTPVSFHKTDKNKPVIIPAQPVSNNAAGTGRNK